MAQTKIDEIVSEWVREGIHISKETIEYLICYCNRKMDVCGIENREEYLPLLFRDELKNHLFRECVNGTTLLRMQKGEYLSDMTEREYLKFVGENLTMA